MERRERFSVALHRPWLDFMRWIAAERGEVPAELARNLLEQALERMHDDPAVQSRWAQFCADGGDDVELSRDITVAFHVRGVVNVLAGQAVGCDQAALQAARFLQVASLWLDDPRPPAEKGAPPRLRETAWRPIDGAAIEGALAHAGDGDGATRRQVAKGGIPGASDKRQLSDTGGVVGAGADHAAL